MASSTPHGFRHWQHDASTGWGPPMTKSILEEMGNRAIAREFAKLEHKSVDLRKYPHPHVRENPFQLSTDALCLLAACRAAPLDMTPRLVFADWLEEVRPDDLQWWSDFIKHQIHKGKSWTISGANPLYDWRHPQFGSYVGINLGFDDGWQAESYVTIRGGMIDGLTCTMDEWEIAGNAMLREWPLREVFLRTWPDPISWVVHSGVFDSKTRALPVRITKALVAQELETDPRIVPLGTVREGDEPWHGVNFLIAERELTQQMQRFRLREVQFTDRYGALPQHLVERR